MQKVWCAELCAQPPETFRNLYSYDFANEWSVGHSEQSPLCRIIWGYILSDRLSRLRKPERFSFRINRYDLTVYSEQRQIRFLLDVMNNPKFNVGRNEGYDHRLLGNFAPVPGSRVMNRSLQFIHKDLGERWDAFLEYLKDQEHWSAFQMGFSFDEYVELTSQEMYFCNGRVIELKDTGQIKALIRERGQCLTQSFMEILRNQKNED